jgi:hypothetical protein
LGWPFVPIEPAQLSEEGVDQESHRLARTFDRLLELPSAVAFVDEVEEIASTREEERKVTPRSPQSSCAKFRGCVTLRTMCWSAPPT